MTDNEIIKGLECCCASECDECPYDEQTACVEYVKEGTLDLINRQKAEIERLKAESDMADGYADALVERTKTEAIKEVLLTLEAEAESSDKYIREYDDSEVQRAYNKALWKSYNLVKEMTEQ